MTSSSNEVLPQTSTRVGGASKNEETLQNSDITEAKVSPALQAEIERKRQRALILKQSRLIPHPYAKINTSDAVASSIIRVQGSRFIDTGGGFLIEEGDLAAENEPKQLKEDPAPIIEPERPTCEECGEKFPDSFLFQNFAYPVCDLCRDNEDKHALITRTEAKAEYLLKDCDFDKREPQLMYIRRKNPHNQNWGEMKLYLQLQIEKRALEVWGNEEALEEQRDMREEKREKAKFKKYQKNMKELRMQVRSSLFDRTSKASHTHEFGPETYNEDDDVYCHTCTTCGFFETFEKIHQDSVGSNVKEVVKQLYDFLKLKEEQQPVKSDALPELLIDGLDEEQIWQELNIQNEEINNQIVKDVAIVLAKKDNITFDVVEDGSDGSAQDSDEDFDDSDEGESLENSEGSDEEEGEEDDKSDKEEQKSKFTSELDDDFFKLSEMENYCEAVEKTGDKSIGFNLFTDIPDDDDEENRLIRYNDFFGRSKSSKKILKDTSSVEKKKKGEKKVKFIDTEPAPSIDEVEDYNDSGSDESSREDADKSEKSPFEARQDRLKAKIAKLEEDALKEKEWHLKGEVTSSTRPQNSLLEEYVEFDVGVRSAPVFTEKTTLKLEDIIVQRIKDKSWDDVIRKIKPVEDIREYKKELVLNQEKSKVSLAEIYEQAFIKQRDAAAADPTEEKEEVEPPEHIAIKKMMRSVFSKLDALSNFHYTPKPVAPEIKIISNLPAIMIEEVAPVATSDAALLAPEEVKNKPKGETLGKSELSSTDKKRERRKKKLKQRLREKEKLKKEKLLSKMPLGLGNKYSKEKAKRMLDKLTKEKNIDTMAVSDEKQVRSSTAFFSKLEDDVKNTLKRKAQVPKKKKMEKLTAKRIKL